MDITFWIYILISMLLSVCMYYLSDSKSRRIREELNKIPGFISVPFLGTTYKVFGVKRKEFFSVFDESTKKFWPIFRSWNGFQGEVHLSDAEHIELVLGSTVNITKGYSYKFLQPWLGTGLLTSTGKKWHTHRKLLTPAFHFKILENFVEVFGEKSEVLVQKLEKEIGNTKGFDVYPYITLCALDIICETAMGTQINAQDHTQSSYVKAVYEMSELIIHRFSRPWLHFDFTYALTENGKRFQRDINILHDFTKKVIRERKEALANAPQEQNDVEDNLGRKRRLAFLDLLLEASRGGALLSDEEIREEVDTFMFEGHDTTSASMCWTLFLIGLHPNIQEKVYEEQWEIFNDSDRNPTMGDLAKMKYLDRVIKESLRLFPSVPFISRHVTQDIKVGEYVLPEGSSIMLHIYHVHRNPKYFPNPDKFDPDNFLPEKIQGRHPFAYVPFSAGSRNCIGQKFALLEEKTVLSAILRKYRIKALDHMKNITLLGELVLRPAEGIQLTIEKR